MSATAMIRYRVGRETLVGLFWRRMMLRPRRIGFTSALVLAAGLVLASGMGDALLIAGACIVVALAGPFSLYRGLRKAIDANPQFTDEKMLAFDAAGLVITGPDWDSAIPWTRFSGFREDRRYFYLELGASGIASVFPKHAFDDEQRRAFRAEASRLSLARRESREA